MTKDQPNFIVIVADDLGFTDTSAFGGEIDTPNLKRLAENGLRFTDFHTASACSPTRSMLMSGTDNHIAGVGQMSEYMGMLPPGTFEGKAGYEGYLNHRVAALSEILQDKAGYYTFLSGKWHLGLTEPFWPSNRGFNKSFGLLPGSGNHYKYFPKDKTTGMTLKFQQPLYQENGRLLNQDTEIPDNFYSTDNYTDKFIEYMNSEDRCEKPFFGLMTYTAPHWPYQAPRDIIEKYKGVYNDGPAKLREKRLANALKMGIIPDGIKAHDVETLRDKSWEEMSEKDKAIECRVMEVYAAMVDVIDQNIGRVIDAVEANGELDNTFILFMSDNGAEGMLLEAMSATSEAMAGIVHEYFDNSIENIGNANSFVWYSDQWAQASTAPHYMYKMWASEGGIRCPLIVHHPKLISEKNKGSIKRGFTTVMDILPTLLDLAGCEHPAPDFQGRKVVAPRGSSWVKYIKGESEYVHDDEKVTGWELFAQQAIRKGKYKALWIPKPVGPEKWQLFDMEADPGETNDLAETMPDKLSQMIDHWAEYVAETGLVYIGSEFYDAMKTEYQPRILFKTSAEQ